MSLSAGSVSGLPLCRHVAVRSWICRAKAWQLLAPCHSSQRPLTESLRIRRKLASVLFLHSSQVDIDLVARMQSWRMACLPNKMQISAVYCLAASRTPDTRNCTLRMWRLCQLLCLAAFQCWKWLTSWLQASGSSTCWSLGQQQEGSTTKSSQQEHGEPSLKGKPCGATYWLYPAGASEQSALF